jgi:hypothetical protein
MQTLREPAANSNAIIDGIDRRPHRRDARASPAHYQLSQAMNSLNPVHSVERQMRSAYLTTHHHAPNCTVCALRLGRRWLA